MAKIALTGQLEEELENIRQELSKEEFSRKVTNVEVFAFLLRSYRTSQQMPEPQLRSSSPSFSANYAPTAYEYQQSKISSPSTGGVEFSDIQLDMDD
jgi:hypothetical protein